jgi:glycosyltransferase involved in cell wall biosynthesis
MLQLGHAAIRKGHQVFVCDSKGIWGGNCRELVEIYPYILLRHKETSLHELSPDFVVSVHPQLLRYGAAPETAVKVAIHPALYFIEMPYTYTPKQTADLFWSIQYDADFVIVQNERMREFLGAVYEWIVGWKSPDRILVSPLGVFPDLATQGDGRQEAREAFGLAENDIAIINAGGVWHWTDFENFLLGFIAACRSGRSDLKLILSGLRQAENTDHEDTISRVYQIFEDNADLVVRAHDIAKSASARDGSIFVEMDWTAGSRNLPFFLRASDVGLSVSKDSLENWQSHRVRLLDYAQYGLPVIATVGDSFADFWGEGCVFRVAERSPKAYEDVLCGHSFGQRNIQQMRELAKDLPLRVNADYDWSRTIDRLIEGGKRDHSSDVPSVIEFCRNKMRHQISERASRLISSMITS